MEDTECNNIAEAVNLNDLSRKERNLLANEHDIEQIH